jgi:hypothetical protein
MTRRALGVAASAFVAAVVLASLTLMPSPGAARLRKADQVRVQDLETIRNAVRDYVRDQGQLPENLEFLSARGGFGAKRLRDPVTGTPYGYRALDPEHFEVCATFARDAATDENGNFPRSPVAAPETELWEHGAGEKCFRFAAAWPK